jgi:hypothetical protein
VRNEIVRHPGAPGTLEELHGLSEVVLTGRVASNTTRPTDDGKSIETIYLVDVLDVMKGSPGATAIRMATVGGQTVFPDGSVATVQTPHYMKPVNGETLLLFLRHQRAQRQELSDANIFVPTCDQLGIYNLAPAWSKWIMTSGDFDTPLAHWIANQRFTMQSFLDRVRMIGGTR